MTNLDGALGPTRRSLAGLALAFVSLLIVGCVTADPRGAFGEVDQQVRERSGNSLRWMRDESDATKTGALVAALLQTNLTAPAAVTLALLHNRSLQAEFEELGISQAELAQASRLPNPVLAGSWRVPLDGVKAVNADYGLAQDFLNLLVLPVRKKLAARQLEITRQRLAHHVLAFTEEVWGAFHTLQARQQFSQRMGLIVEVNEAAMDVAQRQYNAGNINSLELKSQQLAYTQSRLDAAKLTAQIRADREKLNRLMGLWGAQTAWQVRTELAPLPTEELSVAEVEQLAISRRLDLAAARQEVAVAAAAWRLKQGTRYLPGIMVGASAERDLDGSWLLGPTLDLELPLFDQGQPELALRSARYRQARNRFEALAIDIRSEVREARDALIAARDVAAYHQKFLLPQTQQLLHETLLQYNAMQLGNFDLLLAKQREQQAEQAAIEALRDYWIAHARLLTACGGFKTTTETPSVRSAPTAKPPAAKDEPHHH